MTQGRARGAEDRERIAADQQDQVIQRIFAAGLTFQEAASLTGGPEVRRRVEASVDDLDDVLRSLRDTIFGLITFAARDRPGRETSGRRGCG
jgi:signal transduction histidine kinase